MQPEQYPTAASLRRLAFRGRRKKLSPNTNLRVWFLKTKFIEAQKARELAEQQRIKENTSSKIQRRQTKVHTDCVKSEEEATPSYTLQRTISFRLKTESVIEQPVNHQESAEALQEERRGLKRKREPETSGEPQQICKKMKLEEEITEKLKPQHRQLRQLRNPENKTEIKTTTLPLQQFSLKRKREESTECDVPKKRTKRDFSLSIAVFGSMISSVRNFFFN